VIIDGDDIYGDGVNIAARLEPLAEPGGICVSSRVQEDTSGRVKAQFEDIGIPPLKNIARPIRVYRVRAGSAAPAANVATVPAPALTPTRPTRSLRLGAAIAGVTAVLFAAGLTAVLMRPTPPAPSEIGDAVPFARNAVALSPPARSVIAREAAFLKHNPAVTVTIRSYCTPEEGKRFGPGVLATLRSNKVRDDLVALGGIAGTRIAPAATAECNADSGRAVVVRN
jgi:hypothetical protein